MIIGAEVKVIQTETGECVEETRPFFESNVVRRRVIPCPKEVVKRLDSQTNEPTVQPTNSNSLNRGPSKAGGSNGKNLKKKRKNRRIAG